MLLWLCNQALAEQKQDILTLKTQVSLNPAVKSEQTSSFPGRAMVEEQDRFNLEIVKVLTC